MKIHFNKYFSSKIQGINTRVLFLVLFLVIQIKLYAQVVNKKQNSAHDAVTDVISIIPFYNYSQDADTPYQKVYGMAVHPPYANISLKWTLKPDTNKYVEGFSAFAGKFYPFQSKFYKRKFINS